MPEFLTRLGRRVKLDALAKGYRIAFSAPGTDLVLPDLAEFCGANDPAPKTPDLFMQGRAAGRRDVWLRLQQFLNLSDRDLMNLMVGQQVQPRGEV